MRRGASHKVRQQAHAWQSFFSCSNHHAAIWCFLLEHLDNFCSLQGVSNVSWCNVQYLMHSHRFMHGYILKAGVKRVLPESYHDHDASSSSNLASLWDNGSTAKIFASSSVMACPHSMLRVKVSHSLTLLLPCIASHSTQLAKNGSYKI